FEQGPAHLCDAAVVFPGTIRLLHGLPRGAGAVEARSTLSDFVLPDGVDRRRDRRRLCGPDRSESVQGILRAAAGADRMCGAGVGRLASRPGRQLVAWMAGGAGLRSRPNWFAGVSTTEITRVESGGGAKFLRWPARQ